MLLVTGGLGFIGSNFILHVLSEGQEERIVNLDCQTYAGNLENLRSVESTGSYNLVKSEIGNYPVVLETLQKFRPSAVLNFAAESHVDRSISDPRPFIDTNVTQTCELLRASHLYWQSLRDKEKEDFRFIHVSTDEVFGSLSRDAECFTENTKYRPNSPYAASKASSDHFVRVYYKTFGLPVIITNCSNNYGPYQFPEKLIPLTIQRCLAGEPIPIYGDGSQIRDWLFVIDHCEALRRVLQEGIPGETYNIGGNNEKTNLEVVTTICKVLDRVSPNPKIKLHESLITFVSDRPGHDTRYGIDSKKIQRELGWKAKTSFDNGIENTIKWYLDNKEWLENLSKRKEKDTRNLTDAES